MKKQNEGKPKFTFEIVIFTVFSYTSPATRDVFFEENWVSKFVNCVFWRIKAIKTTKTIDFLE